MRPDERVLHLPRRGRGRQHVVDAPADVVLAGAAPLPPPRVVARLAWMTSAERVHPAGVDPARQLRALLRQEAAGLRVGGGAGEVDRLAGRVVVADDEDRPVAAQRLQAVEERRVEVQLVGDAAVVPVAAAALGEVDRRHAQATEGSDDQPALGVEPRLVQPGLDPGGRLAGVDRDAAVAGPLGGRERRLPAQRRAHRRLELVLERAHLLDPDDIRLRVFQETEESLPRARAQAVDVPAYDAHFVYRVIRDTA